ncbi:D-tyrosyl-tRNA(Tyr) deacylase [bacterium]|nr:D-tyrosyl-tRNA(Tyr) deacylase [bacterium]
MIAVVQRVSKALVSVGSVVTGSIENGLLVLLGVEQNDSRAEADYLLKKTVELRIFNDEQNKMNRSLMDIGGSLLVVSQFTLLGDCRKGRRPSFNKAASPELGETLYEYYIKEARKMGITVETGFFGAMMDVNLVNQGPVTILLDSRRFTGERIPIVS